jgi:aminoglycoside phosphotransferase (APT) family kinase protein
MALTREQLDTILARALPGERLKEAREAEGGRYTLLLAGGERLTLQPYATPDAAAAAAGALRRLRAEVDLPIPQLRAADEASGSLLLSEVSGEPLARLLPRLGEQQLYELGLRLGETLQRVHRVRCEHYGPLAGGLQAADEHGYVLARLEAGLERAGELGLLDRRTTGRVRRWYAEEFRPAGREAALLHGGLSLDQVLVRPGEGGWRVSAILGWERALGWTPAWEHAVLLDSTDRPRCFSLRVGYGNGYDAQTERAYEQTREPLLAPYRALLALERLLAARQSGDLAASDRARAVMLTMFRLVMGET